MINNLIELFVVVVITMLFWEILFRHYYQNIKKTPLFFSIRNYTLLDKNFTKPDCYKSVEWYEGYINEARHVFHSPRWVPYRYWSAKQFNGQYINISNSGVRKTWNSNLSTEKEPLKILMFGGSTLWGWGARDDHTIPSEVSKILTKKFSRNVAVYNFGQLGYVNTQEMIYLVELLRSNFRPDIVVFYDGLNDIFSAFQSGAAGIPQNEINRKYAFEDTRYEALLRIIKNESYLYRQIKAFLSSNLSETKSNYQKNLYRQFAQTYFNNLQIIEALANKFSFQYLSYWQPILFSKKHLSTFEEKLSHYHHFWKEFYNEMKLAVDNYHSKSSFFIDISNILDNYENDLFVDPWHLSEDGNRIIAEQMVKDINRLLLAKN